MKKFINKYTPILWGICWAVFITAASLACAIWSVKCVLHLIGVI